MHLSRHTRRFSSIAVVAWLACVTSVVSAFESPSNTNPISRIARVFDSKLVKVEDRVEWLSDRIATFAQHREHAMKVGLGYRGGRVAADAADPSITLDLGSERPISGIFLVPAQREFAGDSGIFPKFFTLTLSRDPDFTQGTVVYASESTPTLSSDGNPLSFPCHAAGRYVRLTVHQGHNKGMLDLFGLSEIAVISNGEPVSFNATVTFSGNDLNVPGLWYPQALTDGRTPLGIWQNGGEPREETGDAPQVSGPDGSVSWAVEFDQPHALDRVILFPYQLSKSFESLALSESIAIYLTHGGEERLVHEWRNPVAGASVMTPLVIPLAGQHASGLRVVGVQPHVMGDSKAHPLAEIEVWSGGKNLASGLAVTRSLQKQDTVLKSLTDGYTSEKRISSFAIWLEQLAERGKIERELEMLRPVQRQLASESELNATWGSAMIFGLTFLIPVFIVERRRLMSKDLMDQMRKRIAADLHDDIGSNLGSISLIARSARKDLVRLQGPEEIAEDLGEVESIARESSLAMRDIVWLLERKQDSIGDLVERMRETAGRLLREIHYTVECESHKTAAKLSLDAKRHLFLFYKEAIHNVLKHSQANTVTIRLWDEDDKLALEILDNGIGLPGGEELASSTVPKLADRARVLDGSLQVVSSKESGTQIRLLVKRSHLTAHPTFA